MAIVNPPYLLDERMRSWLPLLQRVLAVPGAGGWEVRMQGAEPASFPPV